MTNESPFPTAGELRRDGCFVPDNIPDDQPCSSYDTSRVSLTAIIPVRLPGDDVVQAAPVVEPAPQPDPEPVADDTVSSTDDTAIPAAEENKVVEPTTKKQTKPRKPRKQRQKG